MHYTKELIISLTILASNLFAEKTVFRGKNIDDFVGTSIPMSFTHLVSNNYNILPSQINPQRGSYMIITPDGIAGYLDDFVEFKNSQGFDVYVWTLSETGELAIDVKNAIGEQLANDPMLEYVLLIGDVDGFAACPSFYYGPENDVTDQQYGHLIGDDVIPDVFVGRLSIDSLSDLAVIMSKTIQYARNPLAYDDNWLDKGLIVAGNYSNTYPIPITPKWTSYWLREELLDFGYSEIDTVFYPPTQQGASYIIPIMNEGVGIVNYRGWGDANGWHYPEFHVEDVNDLNNGWLTPVFMSYVCNSNDFANNVDPCLSEAILRGGTPTVPKGGVAFIGPSDLHTSTKYNNVINAYMYDAMLNYNVVELGPAMQAGQYGLTKEFPAQDGQGEAQEFYSNVYNILGDPSLQVYLERPKRFIISASELSSSDTFLELMVTDSSNGLGVVDAVISIMAEGQILSKGLTDGSGKFVTTLEIDGLSSVVVYANKSGYMQGKKTSIIVDDNQTIRFSDLMFETGNSDNHPSLGSAITFSFKLENISAEAFDETNAVINFSDNITPSSMEINIPNLSSGEATTIDNLEIIAYGIDTGNSIVGNLTYDIDTDMLFIISFAITLERPVFGIEFQNQVAPGSEFEPQLEITNYSSGHYENILIEISALSDGAEVVPSSTSNQYSSFNAFESSISNTNYEIILGDVSYGSEITFLVDFLKNERSIFSQEVPLNIAPLNDSYPVAPNNFGYWAYDDTDIEYDQRPIFEWIELDPNFGGSESNHHQLDDDDHVELALPFIFKYHGIDYDSITISSNGWTSFESCEIDYFWNMSIPMYMGPKAMLAPFSDDLETIDSDGDGSIDKWIDVYTYHDQIGGKFIIEWSRALNGYDETTEETFQIILYNQQSMPTESGNGVIEFQYLEIDDVDVTKNYSTVGIEAPEKNYGIQYVFNNVYAPGAAPLEDERAIRFTTESPSNYVASLETESNISPDNFMLRPAYPNPFNPETNISFMVPITDLVMIRIYDMLGREILELHNGTLVHGNYNFKWSGINSNGITLASGTYFVVVEYGDIFHTQKLLLLK